MSGGMTGTEVWLLLDQGETGSVANSFQAIPIPGVFQYKRDSLTTDSLPIVGPNVLQEDFDGCIYTRPMSSDPSPQVDFYSVLGKEPRCVRNAYSHGERIDSAGSA